MENNFQYSLHFIGEPNSTSKTSAGDQNTTGECMVWAETSELCSLNTLNAWMVEAPEAIHIERQSINA